MLRLCNGPSTISNNIRKEFSVAPGHSMNTPFSKLKQWQDGGLENGDNDVDDDRLGHSVCLANVCRLIKYANKIIWKPFCAIITGNLLCGSSYRGYSSSSSGLRWRFLSFLEQKRIIRIDIFILSFIY